MEKGWAAPSYGENLSGPVVSRIGRTSFCPTSDKTTPLVDLIEVSSSSLPSVVLTVSVSDGVRVV
jgi:hypothetical protein